VDRPVTSITYGLYDWAACFFYFGQNKAWERHRLLFLNSRGKVKKRKIIRELKSLTWLADDVACLHVERNELVGSSYLDIEDCMEQVRFAKIATGLNL
jgi:hypothetical protein